MNSLKINEFYFIEYHRLDMIHQLYIVIILNKYEAKIVKSLDKTTTSRINDRISIQHYLYNFRFVQLTKLDKLKYL